MTFAVVFPGQGSQSEGMADAWHTHPAGRAVLAEASEAMRRDVVAGCHDRAALATTEFVQPALLACDVAAFRVLEAEGLDRPSSRGRRRAIPWVSSPPSSPSGAMRLPDALGLVVVRGEAMQRAGEERPGTMTALLGMGTQQASALCEEARGDDVLLVANENSPAQVVISGSVAGDRARRERSPRSRRIRAVRLNVAGAFHSELMEPAVEPILDALADDRGRRASVPHRRERERHARARSRASCAGCSRGTWSSPVRWQACAVALADAGATTFLEAGPGPGAHEDGETGRAGRQRGGRRLPRGGRRRGILGAVTRYATIAGVGSSLPPRLVPNSWFESMVETNDEWIRDRTGIEARHFADEGVETSDLAVEAARGGDGRGRHLAAAARHDHRAPRSRGDTAFPATAVWVQQKLGAGLPVVRHQRGVLRVLLRALGAHRVHQRGHGRHRSC